MNIGKNIQHLRKLNRLTQEEMSDKMSVSRQTISRWESDEFPPSVMIIILDDTVHFGYDCQGPSRIQKQLQKAVSGGDSPHRRIFFHGTGVPGNCFAFLSGL